MSLIGWSLPGRRWIAPGPKGRKDKCGSGDESGLGDETVIAVGHDWMPPDRRVPVLGDRYERGGRKFPKNKSNWWNGVL